MKLSSSPKFSIEILWTYYHVAQRDQKGCLSISTCRIKALINPYSLPVDNSNARARYTPDSCRQSSLISVLYAWRKIQTNANSSIDRSATTYQTGRGDYTNEETIIASIYMHSCLRSRWCFQLIPRYYWIPQSLLVRVGVLTSASVR